MGRRATLISLSCLVLGCGRDSTRAHDAAARPVDARPDAAPVQRITFCGQEIQVTVPFVWCRDPNLTSLAPLARLTNLDSVNVTGTKVTDLHPLANLHKLESLTLADNPISDIEPLRTLTWLSNVNLSGTQVADLGPIKNALQLRTLSVDDAPIASLAAARWPRLKRLSLKGTAITDLGPLANFTMLESLSFSDTLVVDLTPIARLSKLEDVQAHHTLITSLPSLAAMASLEELVLGFSPLDDLGPMDAPALRSLTVWYALVSNIDALAGVPTLETINLSHTLVTQASVDALRARLPGATIHFTPWRGRSAQLRELILSPPKEP